MDLKLGHMNWDFDPESKKSVTKMIRHIKDKLKEGFYLYGEMKDGKYKAIQNPEDITDENIKEFLLTKDMKKRMITVPETSG